MVRGGGSPQGSPESAWTENRTLCARPAAIWKKARRGEIRSATPFLDEITRLSRVIRIHPGETLLREATETALRIGHPVYDCLYIACAKRTGSVLVTADRKHSEVVSDRVPDVEVIALHEDQAMDRVEAAAEP